MKHLVGRNAKLLPVEIEGTRTRRASGTVGLEHQQRLLISCNNKKKICCGKRTMTNGLNDALVSLDRDYVDRKSETSTSSYYS